MSASSNLLIMDPFDHHIKCDLCDDIFNSEDDLKEHFEIVHSQNKKRILTSKLCMQCPDGWTYWTYSHHNLRRHMFQHSEFWPSDEVQGLELLCLVKTKLNLNKQKYRYKQNGQWWAKCKKLGKDKDWAKSVKNPRFSTALYFILSLLKFSFN